MIKKLYTLKEAIDRGLIRSREVISIAELYKPYKFLPKNYKSACGMLSILDYFPETTLQSLCLYIKDDAFEVNLNTKTKSYLTEDDLENIARNFLNNEAAGITVSSKILRKCNNLADRYGYFTLSLDPNILVQFVGKEEYPQLILPNHTVYTHG